jgi:hypothetical protein
MNRKADAAGPPFDGWWAYVLFVYCAVAAWTVISVRDLGDEALIPLAVDVLGVASMFVALWSLGFLPRVRELGTGEFVTVGHGRFDEVGLRAVRAADRYLERRHGAVVLGVLSVARRPSRHSRSPRQRRRRTGSTRCRSPGRSTDDDEPDPVDDRGRDGRSGLSALRDESPRRPRGGARCSRPHGSAPAASSRAHTLPPPFASGGCSTSRPAVSIRFGSGGPRREGPALDAVVDAG